jgi:hypothetical protein
MRASRPPRLADWLLFRLASGSKRHSLVGDLNEQYERGRSSLWYWRQAAKAIILHLGMSSAEIPLLLASSGFSRLPWFRVGSGYSADGLRQKSGNSWAASGAY